MKTVVVAIVVIIFGITGSRMIDYHKNQPVKEDIRNRILCEKYKQDLRNWKTEHGEEYMNAIKRYEPELYKNFKSTIDAGVDYAFPD